MGGMSHLLAAERGDLAFETDLRQFGNLILTHHLVPGAVRAAGQRHGAPALARVVPVRGGARRGADAGTAADGGDDQPVARRAAAGARAGHRHAALGDPQPRLDGRAVHRQDGHADRGADRAGAARGHRGPESSADAGGRLSQQPLRIGHPHAAGRRRAGASAGWTRGRWRKIDEMPFDFERRRLSVLLERGRRAAADREGRAGRRAGALRSLAGRLRSGPGRRKRATGRWPRWARLESAGASGCWASPAKPVPATLDDATLQDESELVFAGFAAFLDPPQADARRPWPGLLAQGVRVKVVTGDSELVTRACLQGARACDARQVLLGRRDRRAGRPRRWRAGPASATCSAASTRCRRTA